MLEAALRQRRRRLQIDRAASAQAARPENRLRGLLVLADPRSHRAGEPAVLQRVNQIKIRIGRRRQAHVLKRAAADLGDEGVQLEFNRLGGADPFQEPVVAREHLQQRHVGIVAHGEDIGARPACFR